MKRNIILFVTSLVIVCLALFIACSKSDDACNYSSAIIGKWLFVHSQGWKTNADGSTVTWDEDHSDDLEFGVFNSDSSYLYSAGGDTAENGTYIYNSPEKTIYVTREGRSVSFDILQLTATQLIIGYNSTEASCAGYCKETFERN